jgi:plastocyanin
MRTKIPVVLAAVAAMTLAVRVKDAPAQEKKLATLKGKVTFSGSKPEKNQTDSSPKDEESCGKSRPTEKLLVDEATKGVQDVVIYVKEKLAGEFDPKHKKVVLDQKACVFKNHVTLVAEGGEVVFKNSDTVLHNVKFNSTNNGTFNQGVGAGKEQSQTFKAAEFVTIECSVHPWMTAVVVVMAHPYYALTDSKGEFELKLPPGKHRIMVQHQVLGKLDKKGEEIEVKEGESSRHFEFK